MLPNAAKRCYFDDGSQSRSHRKLPDSGLRANVRIADYTSSDENQGDRNVAERTSGSLAAERVNDFRVRDMRRIRGREDRANRQCVILNLPHPSPHGWPTLLALRDVLNGFSRHAQHQFDNLIRSAWTPDLVVAPSIVYAHQLPSPRDQPTGLPDRRARPIADTNKQTDHAVAARKLEFPPPRHQLTTVSPRRSHHRTLVSRCPVPPPQLYRPYRLRRNG
jgi:hypothetical protein